MVGFYYTRQFGPDGQILCGEGAAEGMSLRELIRREPPPLRATLELGAALGDLLCIAQEDGAVHGGITPEFVIVDEYGDVSIQGMGVPRDGGAAPERRGDLPTVDVFGVGVVVYEAIAGAALPAFPADADAHDDAVVGAVLDLDFSKVQGKKWLDEVRRFVARLLAWSAEDRPAALDAANVLGSVAAQVPGDGLEAWARRALTKPAARAPLSAPAPSIPDSVPLRAMPEILDQPLSLTAPFKPGGVRKAPASKGESTSFWSRERIAEMLAEEDEEDEAPPPPRTSTSKQGRLTAEVELSRSTLEGPRRADPPRNDERLSAPAAVQFDDSRDARANPPRNTRDHADAARGYDAPDRSVRQPERQPEPPRPAARPAEPARPMRPPEPARAEPARPARPMAISEGRAPAPPEPEEAEGGGGKVIFAAGGALFFFLLVCGGGSLLAGGWWWWSSRAVTTTETTSTEAPKPDAAPADATAPSTPPPADPGAPTTPATTPATPAATPATTPATPAATPATTPAPATPKPEPAKTETKPATTTTKPATTTTTTTKPATTTTTKPATTTTTTATTTTTTKPTTTTTPTKTTTTTSGPFTVRFSVPGQEGKISCGDGQVARFSGATNLSFESTQSCRIDAGGLRTVVTVSRASTVSCATSSGGLSCSGGG